MITMKALTAPQVLLLPYFEAYLPKDTSKRSVLTSCGLLQKILDTTVATIEYRSRFLVEQSDVTELRSKIE